PVVIDTDPGIDDMLALFLALASPELDVRGVTVAYGNTVIENRNRNPDESMRRAGKRITLGGGARRPLKRPLATAHETHGDSGLGYAALPPAGVILDFVKSLERLLADQRQPVTLVTLGPVTSLALALRSDPDLVRAKVGRHVAMIGNIAAQGNTTRYAEFNAWCDPEALDLVLKAELPIAALVKPPALTFEEQRLVVDLEEGDHRGHTRPDPQGARVRVATAVDMGPVRSLLSERVFRWAARPAAAPSRSQEARA